GQVRALLAEVAAPTPAQLLGDVVGLARDVVVHGRGATRVLALHLVPLLDEVLERVAGDGTARGGDGVDRVLRARRGRDRGDQHFLVVVVERERRRAGE